MPGNNDGVCRPGLIANIELRRCDHRSVELCHRSLILCLLDAIRRRHPQGRAGIQRAQKVNAQVYPDGRTRYGATLRSGHGSAIADDGPKAPDRWLCVGGRSVSSGNLHNGKRRCDSCGDTSEKSHRRSFLTVVVLRIRAFRP